MGNVILMIPENAKCLKKNKQIETPTLEVVSCQVLTAVKLLYFCCSIQEFSNSKQVFRYDFDLLFRIGQG